MEPQVQNRKTQHTGQNLSLDNFNKTHDDCDPQAIALSLAFKFVPILIYLLLKLFTSQYLITFILIVLLQSFDFWVTKNVTGRKLAGLRWYSKTNEQNKQKWYFQSSQTRICSSINIGIFWFDQIIAIVFWIIITLINTFTLSVFWVFLAIFCASLLIANFLFFIQCKGEHQRTANAMTKKIGMQFFDLNEQKQAKQ